MTLIHGVNFMVFSLSKKTIRKNLTIDLIALMSNYSKSNKLSKFDSRYHPLDKSPGVISRNEYPSTLRSGYLLPAFRREKNPFEEEITSLT